MKGGFHSSPCTYISTFPQNGGFGLQTLIDIYFFTGYIPFRIVYDEEGKTYLAHIGSLPKMITRLRKIVQLARWVLPIVVAMRAGLTTYDPVNILPGPMRMFFFGMGLAVYLCGLVYGHLVSSRKFQNSIVALFNFIKSNGPRSSYHKPLNSQHQSTLVKVYLNYVFGILLPVYGVAGSLFGKGFLTTLHTLWLNINPWETQTIYEMPSWKWTLSFILLWAEIDATLLPTISVILLLNMAGTLNFFAWHITMSIKKSQEYCVVSRAEVLSHYRKLRHVFLRMGEAFSPLTFLTVVTGAIYFCVAFIWTLLDNNRGDDTLTIVALIAYLLYFGLFLLQASQASRRLQCISDVLSSGGTNQLKSLRKVDANSFLRTIAMYELNSGSVGLKVSDVFIINYSLTALVIIAILANFTIVLQSAETVRSYIDLLQKGIQNHTAGI